MRCVSMVQSGSIYYIVDTLPQPTDLTTCAMVLPSANEVIGANYPFNLSASDGLTIAYAIVALWGVGFAGRALVRSLRGDSNEND